MCNAGSVQGLTVQDQPTVELLLFLLHLSIHLLGRALCGRRDVVGSFTHDKRS